MNRNDANITESELRRAYRFSGLWRSGWTFQRAIENSSVHIALCATARALRSKQRLPEDACCNQGYFESAAAGRKRQFPFAQQVLFQ